MRFRSITMAVVVLTVAAFAIAPAGAVGRTALPNSSAPFAEGLRPTGSASAGERMQIAAWLGFSDPEAVEAEVRAVSDPASPDFGRFLTSAQVIARYSPTDAQAEAVASWLRSEGLSVAAVPTSRLFVAAEGTVAQVEQAFGVSLDEYTVGGRSIRAPSSTPSVPSDLAIRGIAGLTSTEAVPASPAPPYPPVYRVGTPCSSFWAQKLATKQPPAYGKTQPYTVCGYTPDQMQGAYGMQDVYDAGYDGSGFTVAIIDAFASPTMQADLDEYSSRHGLPQLTISQITDPPNSGSSLSHQQGWWGEETLDVEAVHAMAPGADIVYRGAAGGGSAAMLTALEDVIGNHRADEVTNSWGYRGEQRLPQSDMDAYNGIFEMAAMTGIGVYFSSGDDGDESTTGDGVPTADFPATSPYVTGVGGTSVGIGALDDRIWETGWGTGWSGLSNGRWSPKPPGVFWYGGGGGTSRVFAQPWYQTGVVPDKLAGMYGGAGRVVPDIAMDGDPNTGLLIGETQSFPDGTSGYDEYRIGGTSLSSPLFAGVMAVADDYANAPHGLVNPMLYTLGMTPAVHDIVKPPTRIAAVRPDFVNGYDKSSGKSFSLRTMNEDGSLKARPGYDDVTGMGTPNGMAFIQGVSGP